MHAKLPKIALTLKLKQFIINNNPDNDVEPFIADDGREN